MTREVVHSKKGREAEFEMMIYHFRLKWKAYISFKRKIIWSISLVIGNTSQMLVSNMLIDFDVPKPCPINVHLNFCLINFFLALIFEEISWLPTIIKLNIQLPSRAPTLLNVAPPAALNKKSDLLKNQTLESFSVFKVFGWMNTPRLHQQQEAIVQNYQPPPPHPHPHPTPTAPAHEPKKKKPIIRGHCSRMRERTLVLMIISNSVNLTFIGFDLFKIQV